MKVIENTDPPRGNGVTIVMNQLVFATQPPVQADNVFLQTMAHWCSEYQKGNPNGRRN